MSAQTDAEPPLGMDDKAPRMFKLLRSKDEYGGHDDATAGTTTYHPKPGHSRNRFTSTESYATVEELQFADLLLEFTDEQLDNDAALYERDALDVDVRS